MFYGQGLHLQRFGMDERMLGGKEQEIHGCAAFGNRKPMLYTPLP